MTPGVMLEDQLSFSCCICLWLWVRPYLTQSPTRLLEQPLIIARPPPKQASHHVQSNPYTYGPECSSMSRPSSSKGTCHSAAHRPPLTTHRRPNLIQVITASLVHSVFCVCTRLQGLNHSGSCVFSSIAILQGMSSDTAIPTHTR